MAPRMSAFSGLVAMALEGDDQAKRSKKKVLDLLRSKAAARQ